MVKVRPSGITVLVVLEMLGGLILLGGGAMFVVLSSFMTGLGGEFVGSMGPIAALSSVIGGIFVVMGLVSFIVAYGYWKGSGWARILGLILAAIGIILGLINLPTGILTIMINAVIVYYLTRSNVIQFFNTSKTAPMTLPV